MPSLGDLVLNFSANTENLTSGISQAKTSFSAMDEVARLSAQNMTAALGRPVQSTRDLALAMHTAASGIESSTSAADTSITSMGTAAETAATAIDSSMEQVKQETRSVATTSESTSTSFLGHIRNMAGGILDFGAKLGQTVFGLQGLYNGVTSLGSAFLGQNASMEQTDVAFETLLGKGKTTQDFLKQLQNFAAATPFEFPELATDAQHMLAFGFSAKDVIPYLTNIGDAMGSMGKNAGDIDHVVEIFGQMHAAGKLNAGDMMQISQEGIPAWKMLADAMHKTVPEVQKLSSEGLIPADKAIQAVSDGMHKMFGQNGGGMAAQAQTFNGILSTFQDNISAAWRAFTGPLFDAAKQGLTQLGTLVSSPQFADFAKMLGSRVGDAIKTFAGWIQQAAHFVQALLPDIQTLAGHIGNELAPIFQSLGHILSEVFPFLSDLGATMTGASSSVQSFFSNWENMVPIFESVDEAIKTVTNAIAGLLSWVEHNQTAIAALQGVAIGIAAVIGTIMVASFTAWAVAAGAAAIATIAATWPLLLIGAVVAGVAFLIISNWGKIAPAITPALSAIGKVFQQIGGYLASVFKPVWDQLVALWTGQLLPLFKQLWAALTPLAPLLEAIGGIIAAVVVVALGLLVGVISAVIQGLAGFLGGVVTIIGGIVQVFTGVVQIISGILRIIVDLCTGNFSDLGAALGEIWQGIVNMFSGVWNIIKGIFQAAWGAISGLVVGFVTGIVGFFQGLYNMLVGHSIVPDMINGIIRWFTSLPGKAIGAVQSLASGLANFFGGLASQALQWGANIISNVLSGIQNAAAGIGNFLGNIGSTIAHTLHIPGFATGVQNFAGGLATINEEGPEMVYLPSGSSVSTASQTQAMLSSGGGGDIHVHTHIYMDGKEITGQVMTRAMKEIRRNGGRAA